LLKGVNGNKKRRSKDKKRTKKKRRRRRRGAFVPVMARSGAWGNMREEEGRV
jgi:hypothetical protein